MYNVLCIPCSQVGVQFCWSSNKDSKDWACGNHCLHVIWRQSEGERGREGGRERERRERRMEKQCVNEKVRDFWSFLKQSIKCCICHSSLSPFSLIIIAGINGQIILGFTHTRTHTHTHTYTHSHTHTHTTYYWWSVSSNQEVNLIRERVRQLESTNHLFSRQLQNIIKLQ